MKKQDWEKLVYETHPTKVAEEWIKKYKNTYVWINDTTLTIAQGLDGKYFNFTGENDQLYKIVFDSSAIVQTDFPKVGAFSTDIGFAIFARIPARQYKKAPCAENCVMFNPISNTLMGKNLPLSFQNMRSAFAEGYFQDVPLLCDKIFKQERIGGAIAQHWAIQVHPNYSNKLVLFYNEYAVAEVSNDGVATPIVPSFIQELKDSNRDFNVGLKIENS